MQCSSRRPLSDLGDNLLTGLAGMDSVVAGAHAHGDAAEQAEDHDDAAESTAG